jgi:hypothetical protein
MRFALYLHQLDAPKTGGWPRGEEDAEIQRENTDSAAIEHGQSHYGQA